MGLNAVDIDDELLEYDISLDSVKVDVARTSSPESSPASDLAMLSDATMSSLFT